MDGLWDAIKVWIVVFVVVCAAALSLSIPNRVVDEDAIVRFAEKAEVPVEAVVIVVHSNNTLPFGDLHEVTYELLVDGKPASGKCTSGLLGTSPLVCLYWGANCGEK